MRHMRSDHEVSARGSDSPRSTAPLAGSTELPRELMSEAKAGNQIGLRPECSFTKTAFNAAQTRPALIIGVSIGLAVKKNPVYPKAACVPTACCHPGKLEPVQINFTQTRRKAPYFSF